MLSLFNRKAKPGVSQAARVPSAAEPPPADNFVRDPDALRLRDELADGRWEDAHEFLESVRDWRLRNFYVNALARVPGRPEWIDEWIAARPNSSVPLLFCGWHRVNWAWEARGSGRAKTVQQDAWPVFQSRLVAADRDLVKAAALDKEDPTPLARSIWVAMGLSLGQPEVRRRFAAADAREQQNQAACYAMIQATARKWGGSHEAMFEFARMVAREAPDGSSGHKMIALAHVERWLDLPREERPAYFRDDAVGREIRAAADRSIRSAAYPSDSPTWADRNAFAFCFNLMHDWDAALAQIKLIGPRITPGPWNYQGKPGTAYVNARERARAGIAAASRR